MQVSRVFKLFVSVHMLLVQLLPHQGHGYILKGQFDKVTYSVQSANLYDHYKTENMTRSNIQCASICLKDRTSSPECGAFHFSPSEMTCKLHALGSTNTSPSTGELYMFQATGVFHPISINGHTYYIYLSPDQKTYSNARLHCIEMGGYLMHFNSLEEYDAIRMVVGHQDIERSYVGANDIGAEGVFLADRYTTPLDSKVWQWSPGEPTDSGGDEDCVAIHYSDNLLYDIGCNRLETYLCERDIEPSPK